MESKLKNLFDYQRFEDNPHLAKLILETEARTAQALTDEQLDLVSAAGDPLQHLAEHPDKPAD